MCVLWRCDNQEGTIRYCWTEEGDEQVMQAEKSDGYSCPEPDSLTEFVIEHYWAYKGLKEEESREFHVDHRPWQVMPCPSHRIQVDIATIYGENWAKAMSVDPVNVFVADGSRVGVTRPQKFTT